MAGAKKMNFINLVMQKFALADLIIDKKKQEKKTSLSRAELQFIDSQIDDLIGKIDMCNKIYITEQIQEQRK